MTKLEILVKCLLLTFELLIICFSLEGLAAVGAPLWLLVVQGLLILFYLGLVSDYAESCVVEFINKLCGKPTEDKDVES